MLMNDMFHQVGMILKESSDCTEYLLDSFPVPICDNIRIFNVKLMYQAVDRFVFDLHIKFLLQPLHDLLITQYGSVKAQIVVN